MELKGRLQGLEWLIEEVEASLHLAYEALESYLATPEDESQVRFCLSYLHQIHGSLKIVECHGPLLLAEEMENLAESMLEKRVENVTAACDVMVQAILKLPAYLRQVVISRRDQPETLLLLLNELRAVQGMSLASETVFFSPDMAAARRLSTPYNRQPDEVAMSNLLRKLRQMYQFALAGVIKDETVGDNFAYLDKVFSRLKELSKGFPREPLWTAVLALLEGISEKEIPLGCSIKMLLQQLDEEIEQLAKMGFDGLAKPLPEPLLKNILFYVAYAQSDKNWASQIRNEYQLDDALPETLIEESSEGLSPIYHPDTAQAIVAVLMEEIGQVKDNLDRYATENDTSHQLLDDSINDMRRIRDSLAVLGRAELREIMANASEQVTAFRANPSDVAKGCLFLVASQLLEVESSLQSWLESNRELMDGHDLVKLEVLGDQKTLYPNVVETIKAADELVNDGFKVMVYTSDDPIVAKELESIGCVSIMPLGSMIGSGLGILNPHNINVIMEDCKVPVLVDAGVGTASEAAVAMEMGCEAVLMNSAIAGAQNPILMASAMKKAVEAGREAFLAGRMPRKKYASASSPMEGTIVGK